MTTAANAKEANRILTILNSSQGILKLCPRKRHDAHPEISMDHSRQKPLRRSLRIKLPGLTKLARYSDQGLCVKYVSWKVNTLTRCVNLGRLFMN